jgi:hypothetical protein
MVFLSGSKTLQASYFPALLWANILKARRTSKKSLQKNSTSNYVRIYIQSKISLLAFYFSAQTFSIVCLSNCFRPVSSKNGSRGRIIFDIVKRLKKPI